MVYNANLIGELISNDDRLKPRLSPTVPFGWKMHPENNKLLAPIPLELKALKQAFMYTDSGDYSWQEMATWLHKVTGRKVSFMGYKKIYLRNKLIQETV